MKINGDLQGDGGEREEAERGEDNVRSRGDELRICVVNVNNADGGRRENADKGSVDCVHIIDILDGGEGL